MGLDIDMYRISVADELDTLKIYSEEEFQKLSFGQYKILESVEISQYEPFHPYVKNSKKIKVERIFWDFKKLLKLAGMPNKKVTNFYLEHEDEYFFFFKINDKEISIPKVEAKNYEKKVIVQYFICKKEEVAYQRGICDEGGEILNTIGNCTNFYGPSVVRMMAVLGILDEQFLENIDENCVFVPWW